MMPRAVQEGIYTVRKRSMSDEKHTQFRFDFGGILVEVSGEKDFVQEIYRRVMEDVEAARKAATGLKDWPGQEAKKSAPAKEQPQEQREAPDSGPISKPGWRAPEAIWVHRSSDLMRKIYMVAVKDVLKTRLGPLLDVSALSNIYVDKAVFDQFFPKLENNQTLWAEFTRQGRDKIAEVTEPMRKARGS